MQICAGHVVKIKPIQYFEYNWDKSGKFMEFQPTNEINIRHNHSRVSKSKVDNYLSRYLKQNKKRNVSTIFPSSQCYKSALFGATSLAVTMFWPPMFAPESA